MNDMKLGVIESRFADIIWNHEPLSTAELISLSEKELKWKRTTTYTVLKRLNDRGIFQNENGTVTSLISRQEFYSVQSERFVEEIFNGSLPAFLTAFTAKKDLTPEEISEIRRLIDSY
jgi:predicted transcriptional regulator